MKPFWIFAGALGSIILSSPALALLTLADDFNGRVGSLSGQVADTGQTWGAFNAFGAYPSFTVGTEYSVDGTEGAGTKDSSSFAGNAVSFTPLSSGLMRFEVDLMRWHPSYGGTTTPLQEFFIYDASKTNVAAIYWQNSNRSIAFEGLGLTDAAHLTGQSPSSVAQMHITLDVNLTTKAVSYSWRGVDRATSLPFSGSVNVGTYSPNFVPAQLQIWGRGESNVIPSGYDNILLYTPGAPGDFNLDSNFNVADINILCDKLQNGSAYAHLYDLTNDNAVTFADMTYEVETILGTHFGDTDVDGDVDLSDLGNLATNYGMSSGASWGLGDFDCDGDVDLNDLGTLATYYGQGSAQAFADFQALTGVSVPEPAGASVLALGILTAMRRRK